MIAFFIYPLSFPYASGLPRNVIFPTLNVIESHFLAKRVAGYCRSCRIFQSLHQPMNYRAIVVGVIQTVVFLFIP
jgi:hypothetical protein